MKEQCSNCQYFAEGAMQPSVDLRAGKIGLCRRLPPVPLMLHTPNGVGINPVQPPVQPTGWCGEFTTNFKMVGGSPS